MISNEDYRDIRSSTNNGLTLLYRYYVAKFGMRLSSGAFMVKFQEWCLKTLRAKLDTVVKRVVDYLDIKHEYQGFIENWK